MGRDNRVQCNVRLDPALKARLKAAADRSGRSFSKQVARALADWCDEADRRQAQLDHARRVWTTVPTPKSE